VSRDDDAQDAVADASEAAALAAKEAA
jgi:hypothetical protein